MFSVAAIDDGRFHWSVVPLWLAAVGYLLLLMGMAGVVWVLSVNKFAEQRVRVQMERNTKLSIPAPMLSCGTLSMASRSCCMAAFPWL